MAKPTLDLYLIDTRDVLTFGLADISSYPNGFSITNPSLEITPPGYNKSTVSITANAANFYRSADLHLDCDDNCGVALPDGIWEVKYSVYPNSTYYIEKKFLRTEAIEEKHLQAFLYLDLSDCGEENNKLKRNLRSAKLLIEGAKAASKDCNLDMAFKLYKKAEQIIDNILCLKP